MYDDVDFMLEDVDFGGDDMLKQVVKDEVYDLLSEADDVYAIGRGLCQDCLDNQEDCTCGLL